VSESVSISRRDILRITAGVGLGAAFGLGVSREAFWRAGLHRVSETRVQMGTLVNITVVHPDNAGAHEMIDSAFLEMERLEAVLSRYRADSAVGRLNAAGLLEHAPSPLIEVIELALEVSRRSSGAFDVTVAPLVELYGSTFDRLGRPPTDREIDETLSYVGHDGLVVTGSTVTLEDRRMAISLDGVAKGFVVDRVVDQLSAKGAQRVLVDAGGDMASNGSSGRDEAWTIGIQHPRRKEATIGRVQLSGGGVATSGDYFRSFTPDHRHHDILDPRTGRPAKELSSASLLASSAMIADALSTAALVLGPVDGIDFIDGFQGAEGILVSKDGSQLLSKGMGKRLG